MRLLRNAQTRCQNFRHRLHADVDVDVRAARHGPRRTEEGDVDQCVFDDLDAADDRPVEHVAQRHVDTDQHAATGQDDDGEPAEHVLDPDDPAFHGLQPAQHGTAIGRSP